MQHSLMHSLAIRVLRVTFWENSTYGFTSLCDQHTYHGNYWTLRPMPAPRPFVLSDKPEFISRKPSIAHTPPSKQLFSAPSEKAGATAEPQLTMADPQLTCG